jgi:hypothetical protein
LKTTSRKLIFISYFKRGPTQVGSFVSNPNKWFLNCSNSVYYYSPITLL